MVTRLYNGYTTSTQQLHNIMTNQRLHNDYTTVTQNNGYTTVTQQLHSSYTMTTQQLHKKQCLHNGNGSATRWSQTSTHRI